MLPIEDYTNLGKVYQLTYSVFKAFCHWYNKLKIDKVRPEVCRFLSTEKHYLIAVQRNHYPLVYEYLLNKRNQEQFSSALKFIKDLALIIDDEGLIRSLGWLGNAEESRIADSSILLPPKSWLCQLIIRQAHERCLHGGTADTLTHLRRRFQKDVKQ